MRSNMANISTGEIYESDADVRAAVESGQAKAEDIVQIDEKLAKVLDGMSRKERRMWWAKNRKRMNLPRWSERHLTSHYQQG